MTSPPATAPAGATLLRPNAVTRADPMAPWASSRVSGLPVRERLLSLRRRLRTVLPLLSLLRARAGGGPLRAGFLAEGGDSGFDGRVEVVRVDGAGQPVTFDLASYRVLEFGEDQA